MVTKPVVAVSFANLLRVNSAWWTTETSKAEDHMLHVGYDRAAILEENPEFKEDLLVELNKYVITVNSQQGLLETEDSPAYPLFIEQEIRFKRLDPSDFPTSGVVGKSAQRPYLSFVTLRPLANKIFASLEEGKNRCVMLFTTKECKANATAERAAEEVERGRVLLTREELSAPGGARATIYPSGYWLNGREPGGGEFYTVSFPEAERAELVEMTVVDLEWGGDGNALLADVLAAVKAHCTA